MAKYGEPLSEREKEVAHLLVAGLPNKEIAQHLSISVDTVKTHLRRIFIKLGASNRTQAANAWRGYSRSSDEAVNHVRSMYTSLAERDAEVQQLREAIRRHKETILGKFNTGNSADLALWEVIDGVDGRATEQST